MVEHGSLKSYVDILTPIRVTVPLFGNSVLAEAMSSDEDTRMGPNPR